MNEFGVIVWSNDFCIWMGWNWVFGFAADEYGFWQFIWNSEGGIMDCGGLYCWISETSEHCVVVDVGDKLKKICLETTKISLLWRGVHYRWSKSWNIL